MIDALTRLKTDPEKKSEQPFLLAAGERRDYNANTIFRDPSWRKADAHGSLRIHPDDARALDIEEGSQVLCRSTHAEIKVQATLDDSLQKGLVTLPHGHGMCYGPNNEKHGPAINELTDASSRDAIAGTPYHKYVPVDLIKVV
jgi:anaerobic selenocysteine-containing dehydrogenase